MNAKNMQHRFRLSNKTSNSSRDYSCYCSISIFFVHFFFEIYKIKAVTNLTMLIEESGVERYISHNGDSSHSFGIYLFSFLGFSFTSLGFHFKKGVIKDYANFRSAT